jgi:hypothetical protein
MENKLIAKGITTDLNPYTFSGIINDEPIIVITEDGFKYKGELIEDGGEIYKLLKEFLQKSQITKSNESKQSDECLSFISLSKTTSPSICSVCGKEKSSHKL